MHTPHLQPVLAALHAKDPVALAAHVSADFTLRSPILPNPVSGQETLGKLPGALFFVIDDFSVTVVIEAEKRAVVFVSVRAGDAQVDGVDDIQFNDAGLVRSMTVYWRPMEQVVAFQQKLAAKAGCTPLRLVPA